MVLIDQVLIEDEVLKEQFVCNLKACRGICCVEGDSGAPLEPEETIILENIWLHIKPFMNQKGIEAVEKQGTWIRAQDGSLETPLVNGKECAYTIFENGIAACGIEKAFLAGATDFRKPVSCHLYPVRIDEQKNNFELMRYDVWDICAPACKLGAKERVPVFRFVKDAIIRKYGTEFYEQLEAVALYHELS
jgi:hypothetical protein